MKKSLVIGALVFGLTAGGTALTVSTGSQDVFAYGKGFRAHGEDQPKRLEKKLERLSKELNLTSSQKTQLKSLFEDQRAKMKALREETRSKMVALLTAEQKAKLEKLREGKGKKD